MPGSQACRDSYHGPIEKEMCHLKIEKNKLNHSGCLLSQILFHCFVCLCYMYCCAPARADRCPSNCLCRGLDQYSLCYLAGRSIK